MRNGAPTPDEQVLALACKRDVQAAGGLDVCARETGLSDSQISRCCNPQMRDSLSLRDAVTIQSIGHGGADHPHILKAMARLLGYIVVPQPNPRDDADGLGQTVMTLTMELGDVAASVRDALSDDTVTPAEIDRTERELDDLDAASASLRLLLRQMRAAGAPRSTRPMETPAI